MFVCVCVQYAQQPSTPPAGGAHYAHAPGKYYPPAHAQIDSPRNTRNAPSQYHISMLQTVCQCPRKRGGDYRVDILMLYKSPLVRKPSQIIQSCN